MKFEFKSDIAVIVPFYNCEKFFIKRTIESILNQTYKNFKLYVVNDGSCDEKKKMLVDLVKKFADDRIILLHKENSGTGDTRRFGIEYAKEKYIALCDQDDTWKPEKLEKQKKFLIKNNCDFVSCRDTRYYFKGEELIKIKENSYEPISEPATSLNVAKSYLCSISWHGGIVPSNTFFTRDCFFRSLPYILLDKDICEDLSMVLSFAFCGVNFGFLDEILVFYSVHANNKGKSINTNETYNLKHIFYYLDLFEKKFSPKEFAKIKKQTLYNTYLNYSGRLFDAGEIGKAFQAISNSLKYRITAKNLRRFIKYKILLSKKGEK